MTLQEELEILGQTNIFDFLPGGSKDRSKGFMVGDKVKVRYYPDELEYVRDNHPHMLGEAVVVFVEGNHCKIEIDGKVVCVDGEKLILI